LQRRRQERYTAALTEGSRKRARIGV